MPNYDSQDIEIIDDAVKMIRSRAWKYIGSKENLLPKIISYFLENLIFLGINSFSFEEGRDVILIQSSADWMQKQQNNVTIKLEDVFSKLVPVLPPEPTKEPLNRFRAEVLLTAFYFDYFTFGESGEYGNKTLVSKQSELKKLFECKGRFIVISRKQRLPRDHNINFRRPDSSVSEIENEIRLLTLMKEQQEYPSS